MKAFILALLILSFGQSSSAMSACALALNNDKDQSNVIGPASNMPISEAAKQRLQTLFKQSEAFRETITQFFEWQKRFEENLMVQDYLNPSPIRAGESLEDWGRRTADEEKLQHSLRMETKLKLFALQLEILSFASSTEVIPDAPIRTFQRMMQLSIPDFAPVPETLSYTLETLETWKTRLESEAFKNLTDFFSNANTRDQYDLLVERSSKPIRGGIAIFYHKWP